MTTDDDMREIEAAMGVLLNAYDSMDTVRADEARATLLALIRQKLPQTDAEHERAVEAWRRRATEVYSDDTYAVLRDEIDEALRLMRARPVYRDLSQVTAADLERYGPAPTMHAMEPSPEWMARHKAAGEIDRLRRENDELMRAFTRLRDASVRGGLGPEAARLVSEQGKAAGELLRICKSMLDDPECCYPETLPRAIEAAERAGIKPAQHQG